MVDSTVLQHQLDRYRAYFRDHSGQLELLSESADELLRMVAAYILADLTLERHIVVLSDEQFGQLMAHPAQAGAPVDEARATA